MVRRSSRAAAQVAKQRTAAIARYERGQEPELDQSTPVLATRLPAMNEPSTRVAMGSRQQRKKPFVEPIAVSKARRHILFLNVVVNYDTLECSPITFGDHFA